MSRQRTKQQTAAGRLIVRRGGNHAVELIDSGTAAPAPKTPVALLTPAPAPAAEGDYLLVSLKRGPGNTQQAVYERRLGSRHTPGVDTEIATIIYGLRNGWSKELKAEARQRSGELARKPGAGRRDLRDLALVTIDDESAQDHDDAVYCEAQAGGGWRLWVAIADVSAYVTPGSLLDEEASERATSIYFPQDVIPMLPEALSNDMCSLKPDSDRLCLVCEIVYDATGEVTDYSFYEGLMRSAARLTYKQVEVVLGGGGKPAAEVAPHAEALRRLGELYRCLRELRTARGSVDVEVNQSSFIFDEQRRISGVTQINRGESHRMIEECMISANRCAADFCAELPFAAVYRVHEPPSPVDHSELVNFARRHNMKLDSRGPPTSKAYQSLARQLVKKDPSGNSALQILRAMSKAQYKTRNVGHFGLALDAYTHFTSPIRRYADLLVHRMIKAGIALPGGGEQTFDYSPEELEELAENINMNAQRAEQAAYFAEGWQKCVLMHRRIGEAFTAKVVTVTHFGVFVQLKEPLVDGLVHVSELGGDYFEFDARRHRLVGANTKKSYEVGKELRVRLTAVDECRGRLVFGLEKSGGARRPGGERAHKSGGRPQARRSRR